MQSSKPQKQGASEYSSLLITSQTIFQGLNYFWIISFLSQLIFKTINENPLIQNFTTNTLLSFLIFLRVSLTPKLLHVLIFKPIITKFYWLMGSNFIFNRMWRNKHFYILVLFLVSNLQKIFQSKKIIISIFILIKKSMLDRPSNKILCIKLYAETISTSLSNNQQLQDQLFRVDITPLKKYVLTRKCIL